MTLQQGQLPTVGLQKLGLSTADHGSGRSHKEGVRLFPAKLLMDSGGEAAIALIQEPT